MLFNKRTSLIMASVTLALLLGFILVLSRSWGLTPPLGSFLSPWRGVWYEGAQKSPLSQGRLGLQLKGSVRIQVDQMEIPHIFAQYDEDLYYLQGYIEASYRLWQMDITSRTAEGRLSEVYGSRTIELDEMFLQLDLLGAAETAVEEMLKEPLSKLALENYSRGVNDYIKTLHARDYPVEFKLLNYRPTEWTPLRSALIVKMMSFNLSGHSRDLKLTRSRHRFLERKEFEDLFPLYPSESLPIVSSKENKAAQGFAPLTPPEEFLIDWEKIKPVLEPDPANGSNSWAVGKSRSVTGHPILANDVHLAYQLPALWFLIEMNSPQQSVMGASIPGTPGIVIGFNNYLAWSVTNGGSDVMDWYAIQYTDDSKTYYVHDGQVRELGSINRQVNVRGEKTRKLQIPITHHGPVVFEQPSSVDRRYPSGLALRWTAHDPSNEILSFLKMNRAKTVEECRESLRTYGNPQQNFLCVDREGGMGMFPYGQLPRKWPGQGRTILDGSQSDHEWDGFIPYDEMAYVLNPQNDFLFSANQHLYDRDFPYYLNWFYDDPYRAGRIEQLLQRRQAWKFADMARLQRDTYVGLAERALPAMLQHLLSSEQNSRDFSINQKQLISHLREWKYEALPDSVQMTFFNRWWPTFELELWEDNLGPPEFYEYPEKNRTIELLKNEPDSIYWDDLRTEDMKEGREQILARSFQKTWSSLVEEFGEDWLQWKWEKVNSPVFDHLTKVPGWRKKLANVGGGDDVIFANRGNHGPVWSMVVSLTPNLKASGIYPGGQSGHLFSDHYDNWLKPWASGELIDMPFWRTPQNLEEKLLRLDLIFNQTEDVQ